MTDGLSQLYHVWMTRLVLGRPHYFATLTGCPFSGRTVQGTAPLYTKYTSCNVVTTALPVFQ